MRLLYEMDVEATGKKLSKTDMESSDLHIARKLYGPDVHYLSVKLITKVLSKGEKFYGLSGQGWMDGDDFNIREYKFKGFVSPDNEYSDASGAKADYEEGDSVCIKDRRDTFNAYDLALEVGVIRSLCLHERRARAPRNLESLLRQLSRALCVKEMKVVKKVAKKLKKSPKPFSKVLKMLERSRKRK